MDSGNHYEQRVATAAIRHRINPLDVTHTLEHGVTSISNSGTYLRSDMQAFINEVRDILGLPKIKPLPGREGEAPISWTKADFLKLDRAMAGLPTDAAARKAIPIATGFVDYFPDAMAEVARASLAGNKQHLEGQPLHWDKSKSQDEADALMRHFIERGTYDSDGVRHSAKVAWRAMALLQREIDAAK